MSTRSITAIIPPRNAAIDTLSFLSEAKIRTSELHYRRLFEAAQDGIFLLDAISGKITEANPFLKKLLGYSQAELLGKNLWQIGFFKDIKDSKHAFLELQQKGYIRYKDLPLQTKDGHSIDVEFVSNVYMVNRDKVIQCNIRDITDRRKIEEAVKFKSEELERLSKLQGETMNALLNVMEDLEEAKGKIEVEKAKDEAMFASIRDGLITLNNDGAITNVNKGILDMIGWKKSDLLGKIITALPLVDDDGNCISFEKNPATLALSSKQVINATYFFVKEDKTRLPIAINVTPIILDGKTIGLLEMFRDITREQEIDRAKTEFVSLASHQLKTPLGITKWYTEAIKNEGYLDKASDIARDYFDEVCKSNEKLLSLVQDLLSISRIDQGKVSNMPKITYITSLIRDIINGMNILAEKHGITLCLILKSKNIPPIFIDPLRMREVIENLIVNGITYSKSPGKVQILIDIKDHKIFIAVKDNGIGIPKEDRRKVFTKFFRSERAMAKNTQGTGLGLYLVKSYIDGWGGCISIVSKEGKGSTFTISLPVISP